MRRGTVVGMSIPLLSFLAAACGGGRRRRDDGRRRSRQPRATVQPGGNIRVALIQPATEPDPHHRQRRGRRRRCSASTGEYLSLSNAKLELEPKSRRELGAQRRRLRVDVQDPPGRHVPHGRHADCGRRRHDHETLVDPGRRLERPVRLWRCPFPGNTEAARRHDRPSSLSTRRTGTSRTWSAPTTTTRSSSRPTSTGGLGQDVRRAPGPFKLESYTPEAGRQVRPQRRLLGRRRRTPTRMELKFYDEKRRMVARHPGRRGRLRRALLGLGRKGASHRPQRTGDRGPRRATHRQIHMRNDKEPFTDKRVRQAIALSSTGRRWSTGLWDGEADLGNDSPFAPRLSRPRIPTSRSGSRTSTRRSSSSLTRA